MIQITDRIAVQSDLQRYPPKQYYAKIISRLTIINILRSFYIDNQFNIDFMLVQFIQSTFQKTLIFVINHKIFKSGSIDYGFRVNFDRRIIVFFKSRGMTILNQRISHTTMQL